MHDIVKMAQAKWYEDEIGRLLAKRDELIVRDTDADDALAKIVEGKIIELLKKLEELK